MEPTRPLEDDPNLTDKRFPGNPTRSYRTREPVRVVGEVLEWEPHSPEVLQDKVVPTRVAPGSAGIHPMPDGGSPQLTPGTARVGAPRSRTPR